MINSLNLDNEDVYDLKHLNIEGELVIKGKDKYILTPEAYFPFTDSNDFIIISDKVLLKNDEGDIFALTISQYETISDIVNIKIL